MAASNISSIGPMALYGSTLRDQGEKFRTYMLEPGFFDERTKGWPLLSNKAGFLAVALYLLAIPLLTKVMSNRKPVKVAQFVFIHNLSMALLSLWMLVESLHSQYHCDRWDKRLRIWGSVAEKGSTFSPACRRLAIVLHVHFLSKAIEFVDTFIMVLKRNDHQISFLHVYHHATTFLCWWITMRVAPGGDTYFGCAINSFVHVIMYTYYLVASSKVIRIPIILKKSLTSIQLIQFATVLCQVLYDALVAKYRPRLILYLALIQTVAFIFLFSSFFRKAYASKKQR